MVMFLVRHPMVFIFLNLSEMLECPVMLMTNTRNTVLTAKLLRQGYIYRKAFSKFYRRHFDIVSKYNVGLKTLFWKAFQNLNFMGTWCINSEK